MDACYTVYNGVWMGQFKMLHFLFSFIPDLPLGSWQFLDEVENIIGLKGGAVWGLGLL